MSQLQPASARAVISFGQAHVRKGSSVVGREVGSIDWWPTYGVIVIGAELGSKDLKGARAATLGQLVLKPGDLLVFTASERGCPPINAGDAAASARRRRSLARSIHRLSFVALQTRACGTHVWQAGRAFTRMSARAPSGRSGRGPAGVWVAPGARGGGELMRDVRSKPAH